MSRTFIVFCSCCVTLPSTAVITILLPPLSRATLCSRCAQYSDTHNKHRRNTKQHSDAERLYPRPTPQQSYSRLLSSYASIPVHRSLGHALPLTSRRFSSMFATTLSFVWRSREATPSAAFTPSMEPPSGPLAPPMSNAPAAHGAASLPGSPSSASSSDFPTLTPVADARSHDPGANVCVPVIVTVVVCVVLLAATAGVCIYINFCRARSHHADGAARRPGLRLLGRRGQRRLYVRVMEGFPLHFYGIRSESAVDRRAVEYAAALPQAALTTLPEARTMPVTYLVTTQ